MKILTHLLLAISILINLNFLSAQTIPSIEWQKSFGGSEEDRAFSVYPTIDGGFIAAGFTISNDDDVSGWHPGYDGWGDPLSDYWVIRGDASGNIIWQKALGGSRDEWANSVEQTRDGGFVVAGWTDSNDGDVSGNHGGADFWVVKLDKDGNIEWQKALGGSGMELAYSIRQTKDGGYIVAGNSDFLYDDPRLSTDFLIIKLDSSGNVQWRKAYGGKSADEARSIEQISDGGYIAVGFSESNDRDVTGNHGNDDYWIIRLDSIGNLIWEKSLGGREDDVAYSVLQTLDGNFVVAGNTSSYDGDVSGYHGGSSGDYWVVKLDQVGNIIWQKCFGGSNDESARSILQSPDGGFIVAGFTSSTDGDISGFHVNLYDAGDMWLVKLDAQGNLMWQKCLGGRTSDGAFSLQQAKDGGLIVAGLSNSKNGDVTKNWGNDDVWIVKLSGDDLHNSCAAPYGGFASRIGRFETSVFWYDSTGIPTGYRLYYKEQGDSVWSKLHIEGTAQHKTLAGLSPNTTYVWMVGAKCHSEWHSDFSPHYEFTTLPESENKIENITLNWSVYPNPSEGMITLHTTLENETDLEIQILDLAGRKIFSETEKNINGNFMKQFDFYDLPAGTYLIQFIHDDQIETQKLLLY